MPNDSIVITGTCQSTHTIRVWDVSSGSCLHVLGNHTDSILKLQTMGGQLISISYDQTVRFWDLTSGRELLRLEGHPRWSGVVGFNTDKTLMAVACSTGPIKIWRLEDGICVATCEGHTKVAVQLEDRNSKLVSASADGTVRTWNWEDGSLVHAIDPAHQSAAQKSSAVRGIVWTDRYMITGGFRDGLVKAWDKESNALVMERQVGNMAIWQVVGGEGKLVVASRVGGGLHQIMV